MNKSIDTQVWLFFCGSSVRITTYCSYEHATASRSFVDLGGFIEVGSFGEATTELVSKTDTRASQ